MESQFLVTSPPPPPCVRLWRVTTNHGPTAPAMRLHTQVQRQASKALANLGVNVQNKERIAKESGIPPLIRLAGSSNASVSVEVGEEARHRRRFAEAHNSHSLSPPWYAGDCGARKGGNGKCLRQTRPREAGQ